MKLKACFNDFNWTLVQKKNQLLTFIIYLLKATSMDKVANVVEISKKNQNVNEKLYIYIYSNYMYVCGIYKYYFKLWVLYIMAIYITIKG